MAVPIVVVKALVLGATDKKARNIFAVIIAAILVPFITIILIVLSLFGNLENANNSLLDYSFTDTEIPADLNDEQRTAIENMRHRLSELDAVIAEKEENSFDVNAVSLMSVFEHTDHHVDTRLSESENEELFYKNALGKAAEIVRSLKETVMEISLVNNRYTSKLQLPAGDEDIKRAERLLETYSLDACEVSRIDIKNSDLEFINKCSELKFYALNWLSKWTNSMLVQGDAHQVDKLAAIAEAHCFEHIDEAMDAARNINYYDCVPANNEEEYAHYVLYESNREDIQTALLQPTFQGSENNAANLRITY